jgi:16S rRNA (guanine1207-N2)-methyltransferase
VLYLSRRLNRSAATRRGALWSLARNALLCESRLNTADKRSEFTQVNLKKRRISHDEPKPLPIPRSEQLLIDEIPALDGPRVLCTTLGRGQFAAAFSSDDPAAHVVCHTFDIFLADETRRFVGAGEPGRPEVVCTPDFPEAEVDLVAIPVDPRGDAELLRDLLQQGHQRLALQGRMVAATSNSEDQWLHEEMRKLFPKVTRRVLDRGVLYLATKIAPLKKVKNFDCEFAFRDRERLIRAVSRPGVFNHRSLDAGARALLNIMEIKAGDRILDIGCGSGAVALAAAFRAADVHVVALDSHARGVDCTARGAALNGLENVSTILNADGESGADGTFDLALGNPPYYSDHRIAEIFLQAGRRALKGGGRVLMVTKSPSWFSERMSELFEEVVALPHKAYTVVSAIRGQEF